MHERQNWLYASGRTREGKIITNAQAGKSWHQYGLAIDIAYKDKKYNWTWEGNWDAVNKAFKDQGFEILELGELSSKRVYFYRHLLKTWPTYNQIRFPAFSYFGVEGSLKDKIFFNINNLPTRVVIALASRKWEIDGEYPVETFGLFKKIEKTI
jgi:hypothetical protein